MSAVGAALRGIAYLISLFGGLITLFGILLVISPDNVNFDAEVWMTNRQSGPMPGWLRALGPHAFWIVGLLIFALGVAFAWFNPLRPGRVEASGRAAEPQRSDS